MKRIITIVIAVTLAFSLSAQTNKGTTKKAAPTPTTTSHRTASKTSKKVLAVKPTTKRKTTSRQHSATTYTNSSIRGLQSQRSKIQEQIRQQEKALHKNQTDVAQRLQNLMVINSEIDEHQKNIEGIRKDITYINGNISILKAQLKTLEQQLADRKAKYIKSMRYLSRHRGIQDQLMFIFSAKDFSQMYRRLRFIREYAAYQRVQGEMVKNKQAQVTDKHRQMERVKGQKSNKFYQGQKEKSALEGKQSEQQNVVSSLQSQQKTIQKVILDQKKKDAVLNAQIDNLIAKEVAKARARAAAEAKRKATAAAAAKKRAIELAAKKAAAVAEARENARRIAEAKKHEAEMKAEARAAAERRNAAEQAHANQLAREAEADRKAVELKARTDEVRNNKEIAEAREDAAATRQLSTVDRMMSGGFQANRGRLPMPITGNYKIVSHFGQYNVEGLRNVTLDNKGINILGSSGCRARAIYDGEVSSVFGYGGTWGVLVRHGDYISVYCNLRSVSVSTGQKVSARQVLGVVGTDNILQFQLRKEMSKLNPEVWLAR